MSHDEIDEHNITKDTSDGHITDSANSNQSYSRGRSTCDDDAEAVGDEIESTKEDASKTTVSEAVVLDNEEKHDKHQSPLDKKTIVVLEQMISNKKTDEIVEQMEVDSHDNNGAAEITCDAGESSKDSTRIVNSIFDELISEVHNSTDPNIIVEQIMEELIDEVGLGTSIAESIVEDVMDAVFSQAGIESFCEKLELRRSNRCKKEDCSRIQELSRKTPEPSGDDDTISDCASDTDCDNNSSSDDLSSTDDSDDEDAESILFQLRQFLAEYGRSVGDTKTVDCVPSGNLKQQRWDNNWQMIKVLDSVDLSVTVDALHSGIADDVMEFCESTAVRELLCSESLKQSGITAEEKGKIL